MGSIHPLRVGISASALAIIAFGGWFFATDQQSGIRQQAYYTRDQALANTRASERGLSLYELRQQAGAACVVSAAPSSPDKSKTRLPSEGGFFGGLIPGSDGRLTFDECLNNYVYGDGLMYEPTKELLELWLEVLGTMMLIAIAVGASTAAIFKGAPWAFKSWLSWLHGN